MADNEEIVATLESIDQTLTRGFRQIHEDLEKIRQAVKATTEAVSESAGRP